MRQRMTGNGGTNVFRSRRNNKPSSAQQGNDLEDEDIPKKITRPSEQLKIIQITVVSTMRRAGVPIVDVVKVSASAPADSIKSA